MVRAACEKVVRPDPFRLWIGDATSNLAEYRSGTKANDSTSWLNMESMTKSGSQKTLAFRATANKTYRVEWNTGLNGAWLKLAGAAETRNCRRRRQSEPLHLSKCQPSCQP